MIRHHRGEFWRVNSELWDFDLDDDGYYAGTETFLSGSSVPYATEAEACEAAVKELMSGRWVRVERFPDPFAEAES